MILIKIHYLSLLDLEYLAFSFSVIVVKYAQHAIYHLSIRKCTVLWHLFKYIQTVVQPSPPSVSRTFSSPTEVTIEH